MKRTIKQRKGSKGLFKEGNHYEKNKKIFKKQKVKEKRNFRKKERKEKNQNKRKKVKNEKYGDVIKIQ